MCGITGIFGRESSQGELETMLDVVRARGPEDSAIKEVVSGAIGHARLAFVDIENNVQPYVDPETGAVVAFNGEIYNWKQLNDKYGLGAKNDTEVLAKGLQRVGREFLDDLTDSQFAYIAQLPDGKGGVETVVGRDAYGISPLVYGKTEKGALAMASTPDALKKIGVKDIKTVPAGSYGVVNGSDVELAKYFELPVVAEEDKVYVDPAEVRRRAIQEIEAEIPEESHILYTAMGGMDSQSITKAVAEKTKGNFGGAITVVPWDPKNPDNMEGGDYHAARKTIEDLKSRGIDVNHYVVQLTPEYVDQHLDRVLSVLGPDYFNASCGITEHLVATTAREHGGKTVMTAGGPDETGMYKQCAYMNAGRAKFGGASESEVEEALERGARSVQEQFAYSEGTRAGLVLGLEGVENRVPLKFLIEMARHVKPEQRYEISDWGDGKNAQTMELKDKIFWRQAMQGYVPQYSLDVKKETVHGATGSKGAIYAVAKRDAEWQEVRQDFARGARTNGWDDQIWDDLDADGKNPIAEGQAYTLYRWAKNHKEEFEAGGSKRYADDAGRYVYHRDIKHQNDRPICYDWRAAGEDI